MAYNIYVKACCLSCLEIQYFINWLNISNILYISDSSVNCKFEHNTQYTYDNSITSTS